MTQELTASIEMAMASGMATEEAQRLLTSLAARVEGSTIDWDREAGENWARLLVRREVVAFLCTKAALLIVSRVPDDLIAGAATPEVVVVRVDEMESRELRSDRRTVQKLAGRTVSEHFDHQQFSAEELVWATM